MNPDDKDFVIGDLEGDVALPADWLPCSLSRAGPSTLTMSVYGTVLVWYESDTQEPNPAAALTFHPDGRIHRHGRLIGNDAEIVAGLREFVFAGRR